jgi:hypothetical protein
LIVGRYLVYDSDAINNGFGGNDIHASLWRQSVEQRLVHVYDIKALRPVWSGYEMTVGIPVANRNGHLELLRISNGDAYISHRKTVTPRIWIVEADAKSV